MKQLLFPFLAIGLGHYIENELFFLTLQALKLNNENQKTKEKKDW
jgi:hypothetical protein